MARVRGVISSASLAASMLGLCGSLSAKTMRAPRRAKALAVDTKVKAGTITSSPSRMFSSSAAISSASVQEVVISALRKP